MRESEDVRTATQIRKAYRDDVIAIRLALQSHIQAKHSLQTFKQTFKPNIRFAQVDFAQPSINLVPLLLAAIFQKQQNRTEQNRTEQNRTEQNGTERDGTRTERNGTRTEQDSF